MRFRSLALGSFAIAILASALCACSSKAELAGQGAECNLTSDCEDGLVCIPQKSGSSICSSNLGSIQQLPPTPDAGMQAVSDAGNNADGPGVVIRPDTGAPPQTNDAAGSD